MGITGYPWYSTAITRTQRVFRHGYRAWRVPVPDGYLPRVPGCSHTRVAPYFCYKRMLFGLTGAPANFSHMTATHLHDLIMNGTLELFVDDGGSAADTFAEGITKLRAIFQRARDSNLSISASKCCLFQ